MERREDQPDDDRVPGSAVGPVRPSSPAPRPDPDQARQFEEFRKFQEFLRFQEAQRGGDEFGAYPPSGRPPRKLGWLRPLRNKYFRRLLYLALLLLAVVIAYDYTFGGEDSGDRPAAETGGGTYRTNHILSTKPYEAVRMVYDRIAQAEPGVGDSMVDQACGRFREDVQQQFAENMGYSDCREAVVALHRNVTRVDDYAESMPSSGFEQPPGDILRIDSCDFPITGGPPLGVFTVSRVEKGQWLITGHEVTKDCPAPNR